MRIIKKTILVLLVIAMGTMCISGCTFLAGVQTAKPQSEPLPETTSAEANLYAHGDCIYTAAGLAVEDAALDEAGNIVDLEGAVLVAAENVSAFTYPTQIRPANEDDFTQSLVAELFGENQIATHPKEFRITFTAENADTVNRSVTIESYDPGAIYFPYDLNKDLLAENVVEPKDNALPSITIDLDENGMSEIVMIGSFEGEHELVAKNVFGEEIGRFTVTLIPEYSSEVEPDENAETEDGGEHEHEFTTTVIDATEKAQGYTLYTCTICGFSYRDNYTDKLACRHDYMETVIPATFTSGGYTLHTCKICGDTYRDNSTPQLVCSHETSKDTVVAPTCTEQGYTIHECTICHSHTTKDTYTSALGHSWNSGSVTQSATCGAAGTRTYTCTRCGQTKTEPIPATGEHQYRDTVVAPTCAQGGHTVHTCTVCGTSYSDTQTPATGQHSYTSSVVSPDCTHGGHTVHTCSVCGHSYTDTETSALGHDWVGHTELKQVGTEAHNFCKDCGQDFHGWSQSAVGAHVEAHILADPEHAKGGYYSKAVPIYEEVTTYTCSRCGATQ